MFTDDVHYKDDNIVVIVAGDNNTRYNISITYQDQEINMKNSELILDEMDENNTSGGQQTINDNISNNCSEIIINTPSNRVKIQLKVEMNIDENETLITLMPHIHKIKQEKEEQLQQKIIYLNTDEDDKDEDENDEDNTNILTPQGSVVRPNKGFRIMSSITPLAPSISSLLASTITTDASLSSSSSFLYTSHQGNDVIGRDHNIKNNNITSDEKNRVVKNTYRRSNKEHSDIIK